MLAQAHIEIIDDAGETQDRVLIVGAGEVELATQGRCELQVVPPERAGPRPDVLISLRDGTVFVEAKASGTLRVNGKALDRAEWLAVECELIAEIITVIHRRLRVRMTLLTTASLLSAGGAVIRMNPTPLEAWSARAAARGARKVSEHLARLRASGAVDETGKLLVAPPTDMNPDSPTDV